MWIFIFLCIMIFLVISPYIWQIYQNHYGKSYIIQQHNNCGLGNVLSCYFTAVYRNIKRKFPEPLELTWNKMNQGDLLYYLGQATISKQVRQQVTDCLLSTLLSGVYAIYMWELNPDPFIALQPFIQEELKLATAHIPTPSPCDIVLHFRCSDIPFNRHNSYHFLKYEWYINALQQASNYLDKDINKFNLILLNCNIHKKHQLSYLVSIYREDLCNYLQNKFPGLCITKTCNSIDEDFKRMLTAPVLMSNGSSMSYFAGLGSPHLTLFPQPANRWWQSLARVFGIKRTLKYPSSFVEIPSYLARIPHNHIPDYTDVKYVCRLLRKPIKINTL